MLRLSIAGVFLSFVALSPPALATVDDCIACRHFEIMKIEGGSRVFADILARLRERPITSITLKSGAFCADGPGASVAADLTDAAERQAARADEVVRKTRSCPASCAPQLDDADYCAYGDRLVTDKYRLGVVALRLSDLARIYQRADRDQKRPIDILSADTTLHGGDALTVLRDALQALAAGDPGTVPDLRWQASSTEVTGLFDSVSLLADFSLADGDIAGIETALEAATAEINSVRADLVGTLSRDEPVQTAEQLALEERILTGASHLAWVIASLELSAGTTGSDDAGATALRETVGCLNHLSLSALNGSEAPGLALDLLGACRSFEACPREGPVRLPANVSPLRAFLETQDEAERRTAAMLDALCQPK